MKIIPVLLILVACSVGCDSLGKSGSGSVGGSAMADRDNSGVNVRDRDAATKTPIDQNEKQTDVDITAEIRRQIVATQLSVNAQNVKIMTQDGRVTLRGPVKTPEEKTQVVAIARGVAGVNNVDDQVEIEVVR